MDSTDGRESGRNRALAELSQSGSRFTTAGGSKHLADEGGSFFSSRHSQHSDAESGRSCVPRVANLYLALVGTVGNRHQFANPVPNYLPATRSTVSHKVTDFAAAKNPEKRPAGNLLNNPGGPGYGCRAIEHKKAQRSRWNAAANVGHHCRRLPRPVSGLARTISQFINYNPASWGKLPRVYVLKFGKPGRSITRADTGEILYTVRATGKTFTPAAPKGKRTSSRQRRRPDEIIAAEPCRVLKASRSTCDRSRGSVEQR